LARIAGEKRELLRKLFEDGTIAGRQTGEDIDLNLGCFYDWRGKSVPIQPNWGFPYEVVPAEVEDDVRRELQACVNARLILDSLLGAGSSDADLHDALAEALTDGVTADSREIRAADQLFVEFQARIGGEDPLDPDVRELLDYCRIELTTMREQLGINGEAINEGAAELAMMRKFIRRHS
jgi:hypothetical protein